VPGGGRVSRETAVLEPNGLYGMGADGVTTLPTDGFTLRDSGTIMRLLAATVIAVFLVSALAAQSLRDRVKREGGSATTMMGFEYDVAGVPELLAQSDLVLYPPSASQSFQGVCGRGGQVISRSLPCGGT
jgi:hypothetical protein